MEIKQYMKLIGSNSDWLPGKDAIESEIKRCCKVSPHFIEMRELTKKNSAINGIFIYRGRAKSVKLTTCGLTQISPDEYAYGQARSGWGAEITVSLSTLDKEKIVFFLKLLVQLEQYVNVRKTMFTEYSRIDLKRLGFRERLEQSDIAGIVFTHDVKLKSIETIHGSVDFLQIIGVNSNDWNMIKKTPSLTRQYIYEVRKSNPNYYIDRLNHLYVLE